MPDLKISEMTSAPAVLNADIVPTVSGGNNLAATKAIFLTAAPGEAITIQGASGNSFVEIQSDGTTTIQTETFAEMIDRSGENFLGVDANGQIGGNFADGGAFRVGNTSVTFGINITDVLANSYWLTPDNPRISFYDVFPLDWETSVPPDLYAAVLRMKKAVVGLLGGPIP